jgi:hypothetical protein
MVMKTKEETLKQLGPFKELIRSVAEGVNGNISKPDQSGNEKIEAALQPFVALLEDMPAHEFVEISLPRKAFEKLWKLNIPNGRPVRFRGGISTCVIYARRVAIIGRDDEEQPF